MVLRLCCVYFIKQTYQLQLLKLITTVTFATPLFAKEKKRFFIFQNFRFLWFAFNGLSNKLLRLIVTETLTIILLFDRADKLSHLWRMKVSIEIIIAILFRA